MDDLQRRRAGQAVADEMDRQGLSPQQLADMSGVAVVTIRDLRAGKRWPWTQKRNAIELALGWDTGTIAQIAKGNAAVDPPTPALEDLSVEDALRLVLDRSELSPARVSRVVTYYLEQVEDQQHRDSGVRDRNGA